MVFVRKMFVLPSLATGLHSVRARLKKLGNTTQFVGSCDEGDFCELGGNNVLNGAAFVSVTVDFHRDF